MTRDRDNEEWRERERYLYGRRENRYYDSTSRTSLRTKRRLEERFLDSDAESEAVYLIDMRHSDDRFLWARRKGSSNWESIPTSIIDSVIPTHEAKGLRSFERVVYLRFIEPDSSLLMRREGNISALETYSVQYPEPPGGYHLAEGNHIDGSAEAILRHSFVAPSQTLPGTPLNPRPRRIEQAIFVYFRIQNQGDAYVRLFSRDMGQMPAEIRLRPLAPYKYFVAAFYRFDEGLWVSSTPVSVENNVFVFDSGSYWGGEIGPINVWCKLYWSWLT